VRRFADVTALLETPVGTPLGETPWREVPQSQVDAFATTTGDDQWIHVDVERAAGGPFGGTVAHGMLTLSLVPVMVGEVVEVGARYGLNYGFERVRFPAPLRVGSAVRGRVELRAVVPVDGGVRATFGVTVEVRGADGTVGAKPVCVADSVIVWLS
jgi:acyl dehydratase